MYVVYLSINVSLTSAFLNRPKKFTNHNGKMLKRVLSDFETCNYIPASDKDPDSVSFNFLNFIFLIIFKRIANGVTCHCIVAFLHFVKLTLRGGAPCFGGRTISFLVKFESSVLCTLEAYIGHLALFQKIIQFGSRTLPLMINGNV